MKVAGQAEHVVPHQHLTVARGPAPIPIVGIDSSRVIRAAIACGINSSTIENAPACSAARASRNERLFVALNLPHPA